MLIDNIRTLCSKNNIPIYKLEREIGLGNGTIGKWEGYLPKTDNLIKVARYFDVSLDDLLKENGVDNNAESKTM